MAMEHVSKRVDNTIVANSGLSFPEANDFSRCHWSAKKRHAVDLTKLAGSGSHTHRSGHHHAVMVVYFPCIIEDAIVYSFKTRGGLTFRDFNFVAKLPCLSR